MTFKQVKTTDKIILKHLEKEDKESLEARNKTKFHLSDSGQCMKKRYVKRLGLPPTREMTRDELWTFQAGHIFHEYIQGILTEELADKDQAEKTKIEISEGEVEDEHFIGHYDLAVVKPDMVVVYEFKTTSGLKHLKKENKPYDHHVIQLANYMDFLATDKPVVGHIYYIGKDLRWTVDTLEYASALTSELSEKVRKERAELVSMWETKTVPPCTCSGWEKKEKYNGWAKYCSMSDKELKKEMRDNE